MNYAHTTAFTKLIYRYFLWITLIQRPSPSLYTDTSCELHSYNGLHQAYIPILPVNYTHTTAFTKLIYRYFLWITLIQRPSPSLYTDTSCELRSYNGLHQAYIPILPVNYAHTTAFTKLIYRYFLWITLIQRHSPSLYTDTSCELRSYNGLHQAYIPILPVNYAHTTAFTKLIYRYFLWITLIQRHSPSLYTDTSCELRSYNGLHQAYIPILPVNYAHTTAFTKLIYRYFLWITLIQRPSPSLYTDTSCELRSYNGIHQAYIPILPVNYAHTTAFTKLIYRYFLWITLIQRHSPSLYTDTSCELRSYNGIHQAYIPILPVNYAHTTAFTKLIYRYFLWITLIQRPSPSLYTDTSCELRSYNGIHQAYIPILPVNYAHTTAFTKLIYRYFLWITLIQRPSPSLYTDTSCELRSYNGIHQAYIPIFLWITLIQRPSPSLYTDTSCELRSYNGLHQAYIPILPVNYAHTTAFTKLIYRYFLWITLIQRPSPSLYTDTSCELHSYNGLHQAYIPILPVNYAHTTAFTKLIYQYFLWITLIQRPSPSLYTDTSCELRSYNGLHQAYIPILPVNYAHTTAFTKLIYRYFLWITLIQRPSPSLYTDTSCELRSYNGLHQAYIPILPVNYTHTTAFTKLIYRYFMWITLIQRHSPSLYTDTSCELRSYNGIHQAYIPILPVNYAHTTAFTKLIYRYFLWITLIQRHSPSLYTDTSCELRSYNGLHQAYIPILPVNYAHTTAFTKLINRYFLWITLIQRHSPSLYTDTSCELRSYNGLHQAYIPILPVNYAHTTAFTKLIYRYFLWITLIHRHSPSLYTDIPVNYTHTTAFTKLIYRYFLWITLIQRPSPSLYTDTSCELRSYNGLHQAYIPILPVNYTHTTAFTKLIYRYFLWITLIQRPSPSLYTDTSCELRSYNGLHQAYIPILPVNYAHTTAFTKLIYRYFLWITLIQRPSPSLYTDTSCELRSYNGLHQAYIPILPVNYAHTTAFTKLIYRYFLWITLIKRPSPSLYTDTSCELRSYNGIHQAYIPILPVNYAHTTAFTKLIYRYFLWITLIQRPSPSLYTDTSCELRSYNGLHQAYIPILPVNYAHTTAFTKLIYRYFHMHMYQSWIILLVQRHPESLYTSVSISVSSIRRVHNIHNCILYTPIYGTMKEI